MVKPLLLSSPFLLLEAAASYCASPRVGRPRDNRGSLRGTSDSSGLGWACVGWLAHSELLQRGEVKRSGLKGQEREEDV